MSFYGYWIIRYRWLVIATTVAVSLVLVFGLQFLRFSTDNRVFLSEENPQYQAFKALEDTYAKTYNVLFMVAPDNGNVFTREALSAVQDITAAAWKIPYSSRVDSITNFQYSFANGDELVVEDLVMDARSLNNAELARKKRIALSEPFLVNNIISPSGHVTGVNVNLLLPGDSPDEVTQVAAYVRDLSDKVRARHPGMVIHVTGALMLDNAFDEITEADMSALIPVMFAVLMIIVGLFLRSVYGTLATLAVIVLATITALGVAGWMGVLLNPASANAPTIILTLAVADSVHILVTLFQQMRIGVDKNQAIVNSLKENLKPVFLTSVTTIVGFLTMNFSDSPPFRDLGNMVALGIASAFVYSIVFLPALLSVLPLRVKTIDNPRGTRANILLGRLADFVIARRHLLFWISVSACTVLAAGLLRVDLDEDFVEYFSEDYDIRFTADFMEQHLTGADIIEFSLDSGESGGINNPGYLAKIDEFANWYRQQDKVVHVRVFSDVMKRLNRNMHGDDETWYRIPERRELAAQFLLLYELSLPLGRDLNNQINVDKSATRMMVVLKDATTREQRIIEQKGRAWLEHNAPPTMHAMGSGLSIIWAYLTERTINTMLVASFGALILISFILIVALRSVKYGLISLAPNLMPAIMAFGIWGMLMGRVGLALSVVVSMTLGIVVDDTVHFLSRYLHGRRERGLQLEQSLRYAFDTVGEAMWITTVALVAGFLILLFSDYKMNAEMGLMTAITICLALIMDFLFLPTLLLRARDKCL